MTGDDTVPFPPDEFEYLVVAGRLAERIRRGEFSESGKLPVTRELMAHYGVGASVVNHARRETVRKIAGSCCGSASPPLR